MPSGSASGSGRLVGDQAHQRLQDRGRHGEGEGQHPDLPVAEAELLLQERVDGRDHRLHDVVDAVAEGDAPQHRPDRPLGHGPQGPPGIAPIKLPASPSPEARAALRPSGAAWQGADARARRRCEYQAACPPLATCLRGAAAPGRLAKFPPEASPPSASGRRRAPSRRIGPGVTAVAPGDRVVAHLPPAGRGTHADLAVVPVAGVAPLPESLTFEEGATLPLVGHHRAPAGRDAGRDPARRARAGVGGLWAPWDGRRCSASRRSARGPVAGVRAERLEDGRALAGRGGRRRPRPEPGTFGLAVIAAAPVAVQAAEWLTRTAARRGRHPGARGGRAGPGHHHPRPAPCPRAGYARGDLAASRGAATSPSRSPSS